MDWLSVVSLIVALGALTFSLVTYFAHDKKIKKQEATLNAYQLAKIEEEKTNDKKALIRAELIVEGRADRAIRIRNVGKALARNVSIEFLDGSDDGITIYNDNSPYEFINASDYIDMRTFCSQVAPPYLKLKFKWDDEFKTGNENLQTLHLH